MVVVFFSPRWHSHLPDRLDHPDRACAEPLDPADASKPCEQRNPQVHVVEPLRGALLPLEQRWRWRRVVWMM
jgi:hypothetical protein